VIDHRKAEVRRRQRADRRREWAAFRKELRCWLTPPFGHAYIYPPDGGTMSCVSCGRGYPYNL